MPPKLFISYARADDLPFVEVLYKELKDKGYEVWWDKAAMEARGSPFLQVIQDAIGGTDRLILVVGPGAAESDYVRAEWEYALNLCKVINPILRAGTYDLVPAPLKMLHCIDFRPSRYHIDAMNELVSSLEAGEASLGNLYSVPELPPHFLPRYDELAKVRQKLLTDINKPTTVMGTARRTGLQGMGGIGKTVLATAVAWDCQIRRTFTDGVFWLTIGQTPLLTTLQSQLGELLGDNPRNFGNVEDGKRRLNMLMRNKRCLLVLDDVWKAEHASAFDALGINCRILITTRNAELLRSLGIEETPVDVLNEAQALNLLSDWSGLPLERLPDEAKLIAYECGYLPLALAMIGAMLRGRTLDRWQDALYVLKEGDLEEIATKFPDYVYPSLLLAFQVSINDLPDLVRERYFDLAVFAEGTNIPEHAVVRLWGAVGIEARKARKFIDQLVDRSLLQRNSENQLRLHDLQVDFVRKYTPDRKALHLRLLNAYNPDNFAWHTVAHDGYLYFHLAYHMRESGQEDELHRLLTASPDWMNAKFIACVGDMSYAADLDFALAHKQYQGPLTSELVIRMVELYTAKQLVNHRVSLHSDIFLRTLVWLKREAEAFNYVRLRNDAEAKFGGLLAIFNAMTERNLPTEDLLTEAYKTAQQIHNKKSRVAALCAMFAAYAQASDLERATQLASEAKVTASAIEDSKERVETLTNLAAALIGAGLLDQAEVVAQLIDDNRSRIRTVADLATAFHQASRPEGAAQLLSEAETLARTIDFESIRVEVLSKVAVALAQANNLERSALLFSELETFAYASEEHSSTRVFTFTLLAIALAQANHLERSTHLLFEAERIARADEGALTRTSTFFMLSNALLELRLFEWAERITQAIEDPSYRALSLRSLARDFAKAHLFDQAETIAHTIEVAYIREYALHDIAAALAQVRLFDQAERIAHAIGAPPYRASTLRDLVAALAQAGAFGQAERIARAIEVASVRVSALYVLAIEIARANSSERAAPLFLEAETTARTIEHISTRTPTLCTLAVTFARAGYREYAAQLFTEAETTVHIIKDVDRHASVLMDLAIALAQAQLFDKAEMLARSIEDANKRVEALSEVAAALAQAQLFDRAEVVASLIEDPKKRVYALDKVAVILAQAQLFERAEMLARQIEEVDQHVNALGKVAAALAQAQLFERAETLARSIEDASNRVKALGEVAAALAQASHAERAHDLFSEAEIIAYRVEHGYRRASTLMDLALTFTKVDYSERAINLFSEAANEGRALEHVYVRVFALTDLAVALTRADYLARATQLFSEVETIARASEDGNLLKLTLYRCVTGLTEVGLFDDAEATARRIEEISTRAEALTKLCAVLVCSGHLLTSFQLLESLTLNDYLRWLTNIFTGLERLDTQHAASVFLRLVLEATRIAGWEQPGWKSLYERLTSVEE